MALPETINTSYGSTDPVLSADLVAIQECIAGDLHPSRSILLGPSAWQPKIDGRAVGHAAGSLLDSQWIYNGAGLTYFTADLPVPVGHELESIRWYYTRGGAGTITRALYSRDLSTGAAEAAATGPTNDNASGAWGGANDTGLGIIRAAHVAYSLEIVISNAAHVFGGALVTYRKLP